MSMVFLGHNHARKLEQLISAAQQLVANVADHLRDSCPVANDLALTLPAEAIAQLLEDPYIIKARESFAGAIEIAARPLAIGDPAAPALNAPDPANPPRDPATGRLPDGVEDTFNPAPSPIVG